MKTRSGATLLLLAAAILAGCGGKYYRIQDTSTGTYYYAEKVNTLRSGGVEFTDAITGEEVTLPHYTFRDLSKPEFSEEVGEEIARREAEEAAKGDD